jgi:hypothetical protein
MPETSAPGDLWQVIVRSTLEAQHCENVFNMRTATPIDDFELRIILALIQCFAAFVPAQPVGFTYNEVRWKRTSPTLGVEHVTVWQGDGGGDATGSPLPSFCSAVVSIRTNLGGRSHRGRFYVPGIPEDQVDQSIMRVGTPFWTALTQLCLCLATKFINIGDPAPVNSALLGVYSRKLGGSKFPYGAVGFTPATSLTPVFEIGTTRSRKVGHGN